MSPSIDRIAPTRPPPGIPVMRQRWADLLFLHWAVPPGDLSRLLPAGLELDTYEGRAYIGLVPFTMTGVRPVWSPSFPPLSNFHETNVRTYVHRNGRDPGVWFFSLDAASAAAVRVARAWYRLPYHFARMSLERRRARAEAPDVVEYRSERLWPGPLPAGCAISYSPAGVPAPAGPDTLEHFLVERYLLYSSAHGRLYTGRVRHTPYPLQSATVHALEENLLSAAGIIHPDDAPLVHYASEVSVQIFPLRRA